MLNEGAAMKRMSMENEATMKRLKVIFAWQPTALPQRAGTHIGTGSFVI